MSNKNIINLQLALKTILEFNSAEIIASLEPKEQSLTGEQETTLFLLNRLEKESKTLLKSIRENFSFLVKSEKLNKFAGDKLSIVIGDKTDWELSDPTIANQTYITYQYTVDDSNGELRTLLQEDKLPSYISANAIANKEILDAIVDSGEPVPEGFNLKESKTISIKNKKIK